MQPDYRNQDNERPYIKQLPLGKTVSFAAVVIALCVVLCISAIIMFSVFKALDSKNENRETVITSATASFEAEADTKANTEEVPVLVLGDNSESLGAEHPLAPLDEPEVYAAYTSDTVFLDGIRSEYAILIDLQKNEVIAHRNGDEIMYPASMTKVMTLIVAYENIEDMNERFTFDYTITDPAYKAGASVAGFLSSESVPFIDILYGIALPSGADATTAVAVHVAGSEEAFAELMNEKAKELGLENTHFVNASGLHHPDHYTTPHEMAKIFQYAMSIPLLEEIMSEYMYTTTPTPQHPDGLLLVSTVFSRMSGSEPEVAEVIAGKTGYTHEAANCLVSCAETPDGRRFILVTGKALSTASEGRYGAVFDAISIYKDYIPQS